MIEEDRAEAHEEQPVDQQVEEHQEPVGEPTPDEGTSLDSGGGASEVTDDTTAPTPLSRYLRDSGYDVDEGLDEEEVYKSVAQRMRERDELRRSIEQERLAREQLQQELARLQSAAQQPPQQQAPQAPVQPDVQPEPKKSSLWDPIAAPDQELYRMVERNPQTGMVQARDEYLGNGGEEAAKQINEYAMRIKKRSDALLNNPTDALFEAGFEDRLSEVLQKKAEALLDEKLKNLGSIKDETLQELERRRAMEAREERINGFWRENATRLYKHNLSGQPVRDLDGNLVPTEVGQQFAEEMRFMRESFGVEDEEALISAAWRNISRLHPTEETPPQMEEEDAGPRRGTGKEKRRRFVERRENTSPEPPANRDGYRESGTGRNRPPSLMELVEEDPDASQL
jgi:hypothetical protein